MDSLSTLRALADIIAESLAVMERAYKHSELTPPSLDEPFNAEDPAEAIRSEPAVAEAIMNIVAAAGQLSATVRDPTVWILAQAHAYDISTCLRAASQLNVADILREAGPQGLHVRDIASPSHTDPEFLARILRCLATHHVFREVSPDVFANNRTSSILDKGKPSKILFEKPAERLLDTSGVAALVELATNEGFKSSAYITDALLESKEQLKVPFNRAFGTEETIFGWLERPENKDRLTTFSVAMQGTMKVEPPDAIFEGFEWNQLPSGSIVVDVGGGIGYSSCKIAQRNPSLRIVVQDRAQTVEKSKIYWQETLPSHVKTNMVEFQAHNFFESQPVKNASLFLLRHIVHNWSDADVVRILTHLRHAATPTTKLVLVEGIVPNVSRILEVNEIPGASPQTAPAPLLPNYGVAGSKVYLYDMHMHELLGGKERTLAGFVDVLQKSGWKLVRVYNSALGHLVAVPN
ncbi:O-methyltransferase [Mycena rebaudengoi]|nr:O-methyltransferase [Mycena rebaudengoi]